MVVIIRLISREEMFLQVRDQGLWTPTYTREDTVSPGLHYVHFRTWVSFPLLGPNRTTQVRLVCSGIFTTWKGPTQSLFPFSKSRTVPELNGDDRNFYLRPPVVRFPTSTGDL